MLCDQQIFGLYKEENLVIFMIKLPLNLILLI